MHFTFYFSIYQTKNENKTEIIKTVRKIHENYRKNNE